ncbi:MAG TPA: hypothetical protein VFX85_05395 [Solirubrobacterales bacterium]|nr:hypothetical protein [Solirubrobacterales bacterium]
MGRGRAKLAVAGAVGALALLAAGCGAESHPNDPRPQVATRVSVTVTPSRVIVDPVRIGVGPEKTQQIPQNQNHPQPPIKTNRPLDTIFVTANQTGENVRLVLRGPIDDESNPIAGTSAGTLQTGLKAGTYTVAAAGLPGARTGKLVVGPYRPSSQNDVLLP